MSSITLKNIPDGLHQFYKRRARMNSRSLQAEIVHTLAERAVPQDNEPQVKVDALVGILASGKKALSIEEMNEGVDQLMRKSWK